jgi:hypothetical protein
MRCPVDNETLVMADRGGVEIDYCPKCRGVWLDRGELDKIIDRSIGAGSAAAAPSQAPAHPAAYKPEPQRRHQRESEPYRGHRRDDDDDDDYRKGYKKKRRDSFLGELFDF